MINLAVNETIYASSSASNVNYFFEGKTYSGTIVTEGTVAQGFFYTPPKLLYTALKQSELNLHFTNSNQLVTTTVRIYLNGNTASHLLFQVVLEANWSLDFVDDWTVYDENGLVVSTAAAGGIGLTDAELRASDVKITLDGEVVPVTGTFFQATQPVSGTVTINPIPTGTSTIGKLGANSGVDIGDVTINNTGGVSAVPIQDGGNSITVDGAVTVNSGSTLDVGINALANSVKITDGVNSVEVAILGAASTKGLPVFGSGKGDNRDYPLPIDNTLTNSKPVIVEVVDGNGDQITSFGGGTQYADGDAIGANVGTQVVWYDGNSSTHKAVTDSQGLPVTVIQGSITETTLSGTGVNSQIDNLLNQPSIATSSLGYLFDGTTWDRARGDSTDGALVNLGANNDVTVTSGAITETNSAAIKAKTDNIPAQGQALAASSLPVVLTAAQVTTLTPPAAITGFATEAKQDTLLTELQLKADLTETQPVNVTNPNTQYTSGTVVATPVGNVLLGKAQVTNILTPLQVNDNGQLYTNGNVNISGVGGADIFIGQGIMDGSLPVVIASNQTAIPITAASLPLPTGASTEATLSTLNGKIPSGLTVTASRLQVELPAGGTGLTDTELRASAVPVSLASVPSHNVTNAGTFATQATLTAETTKVIGTVNLSAAQTLANVTTVGTITNVVHIDDNAGSITVDGPLTDVQLRATPVPVSGTVTTGGLTDTQLRATPIPISGSVTVTGAGDATAANQVITNTEIGIVTETAPGTDTASSGLNGRLQRIAQRITSLITALGSPFQAGGSIGNTSFGATQATGSNLHMVVDSGTVSTITNVVHVDDNAGSLTIDNSNLDVALSTRLKPADTLTAVTTVGTITNVVHIDDNAGSLTVDFTQPALVAGSALIGKVGIDQTTPGTTNKVSIGTDGTVAINAALPTGTNSIGQVTANAGTNLNTSALALDATLTGGTQKSIVRGGAKGTTTAADVTSTSQSADRNALDVQIRTSAGAVVDTFGGGTQFADGTARGTATGTLLMVDDGTNIQSALGTTAGVLKVDLSATTANATAVKVDGSAATQPISGSVTANAGTNLNTSALALSATQTDGTQKTKIVDSGGTNAANIDANGALRVQSGGTPGSAAPTRALQIAGTDGTNLRAVNVDSTGALRVQSGGTTGSAVPTRALQMGGSDGTNLRAIKVSATGVVSTDGSAVTQPVSLATNTPTLQSGSTTAVTQATGTNLHTVVDSGSITANAGTNLNTSALALDATLTGGTQKTKLVDTGGTNVLSIDANGGLAIQAGGAVGSAKPTRAIHVGGNDGTNLVGIKVSASGVVSTDGSAVTQPVSLATNTPTLQAGSTTAVTQATATNLKSQAESYQGGVAVSATNPLAVKQTDLNTYIGRACTFRIPGRAGTAGQKLFSIHNATGSTTTVNVRKIFVDLYQTVVKLVTVAPPVIRAWKVTVLPTNGTALTKVQIGGSGATSSSVTVLGDASADGTGSGTTLTATLPAGAILSQEFAPRLITAAGYEIADRVEFFDGTTTIKLGALEGLVLFLDYTLATQNPTTDMWIVGCEWDEN